MMEKEKEEITESAKAEIQIIINGIGMVDDPELKKWALSHRRNIRVLCAVITDLRSQVKVLRETLIRCDNLLMPYDAWDLKHIICNDIRAALAATEGD